MKSILRITKEFWWTIITADGRSDLKYEFARNLPSTFGFSLRERIVMKRFKSCGPDLRIHSGARFRNIQNIDFGVNVTVGVDNFLQAAGGLTIGDHSLLGPGVKIWTTNHSFEDPDTIIRKQGCSYKEVTIGRDVWVGANSFIMPGTTLGDGCIVSAGSVVGAKNYPPFTILGGNPARVMGKRQKQNNESE